MSVNLRNRLRPMGITDLLDETVELYKCNFKLLIGIASVIYVPYTLYALAFPFPDLKSMDKMNTGFFLALIPYVIMGLLFYVVIKPLMTGAYTVAIAERFMNREASALESYRAMFSRKVFWPLVGVNLLVFAIVGAAFIVSMLVFGLSFYFFIEKSYGAGAVIILLGIATAIFSYYMFLRLSLVPPAVIVENRGAGGSISRSWFLAKGIVFKIFIILLLVMIVISIVSGVVVAPFAIFGAISTVKNATPPYWLTAINTILSTLVSIVLEPIISIVIVLLYFDARIRKEGFDLEYLAGEIGQSATPRYDLPDAASLPQERLEPRDNINPEQMQ